MIRQKTSFPQPTRRFNQRSTTGFRIPFQGILLILPLRRRGMMASRHCLRSQQSPSQIFTAPPGARSPVGALVMATLPVSTKPPRALILSSAIRALTSPGQIHILLLPCQTRTWTRPLILTAVKFSPLPSHPLLETFALVLQQKRSALRLHSS